jgi:hypothetical protein
LGPLPPPPALQSGPDPRYQLIDTESLSVPRHQSGTLRLPSVLCKRPLFAGPNGRTFTQQPNLPSHSGRVGMAHLVTDPSPVERSVGHQVFDFTDPDPQQPDVWDPDWGINRDEIREARYPVYKAARKDRHQKRRQNQYYRWREVIIPSLVPLLLDIQRRTRGGRWPLEDGPASAFPELLPCRCTRRVHLIVTKVRWDGECLVQGITHRTF